MRWYIYIYTRTQNTHHPKKAAAKISAQSAWALTEVVRFNMITDKARSWERGMCIWKRSCVGLCLYPGTHTRTNLLTTTPPNTLHTLQQVEVMDVEDSKRRTYMLDRGEVALLPRENRKEVLTKHYPKYSRVFAQVGGLGGVTG